MKKSAKNTVRAFVIGLHLLAINVLAAQEEDSLFSKVDAVAAFENDNQVTKGAPAAGAVQESRLISTNDLLRTLQDANFEGTAIGTRAVATLKQLASWQFPVQVTLAENEQDVTIVLGLRRVSDLQKVPAARLLQLLESNEKLARTSFAFNRERSRFELFSLIRNKGITGQTLRDEINRLAILARDTESLWNLDETAGGALETSAATGKSGATRIVEPGIAPSPLNTTQSTAPLTQSLPVTATVSPNSLHGRWSATRSATDAFAILLNADNTFVLVSVSGGQQARSTGKFTLLNNQLTLEGSDGIRLSGTVTLVSSTEFRFEPLSSGTSLAALTFGKAQ